MTVSIRVASSDDALTLANLLTDFNREFDSPIPALSTLTRRFGRILNDATVIAVLAEMAQPVGFALVTLRPTPYYDGPFAQLEELYVAPPQRALGVGTQMLVGAIAQVRAQGAGEMHINVDEIDDRARRFYERHGFVNIEPGQDYRMLCYLKEL